MKNLLTKLLIITFVLSLNTSLANSSEDSNFFKSINEDLSSFYSDWENAPPAKECPYQNKPKQIAGSLIFGWLEFPYYAFMTGGTVIGESVVEGVFEVVDLLGFENDSDRERFRASKLFTSMTNEKLYRIFTATVLRHHRACKVLTASEAIRIKEETKKLQRKIAQIDLDREEISSKLEMLSQESKKASEISAALGE